MKEKNLKILKISDCNIDPEISDQFQDLLKLTNFPNLEWLAYNYNEVNDSQEFLKSIKESLSGLKKLSIKDIVEEEDRSEIKKKFK